MISDFKSANNHERGFTIFELVVVVAVLTILSAAVIGNFALQRKRANLHGNAEEVATTLKFAQNKALSSVNNSKYGVYIDDTATPHKYILFKGNSYSGRDVSADIIHQLPSSMEFNSISLGGGKEVVFNRLTGLSTQSGSLTVRVKSDTSQNETVYVSNSGAIGFVAPVASSDTNRVKDSRHVHFDYNLANFVNCPGTNATISLYFDGATSPQKTISVCSNLLGGQLYWKGSVLSGGSDHQTVEIRTHHLLDAQYANKTQFSIHRDRSLNNKSLKITISPDSSGYLINYSSDGATVTYTSSYVSNLVWQ